MSEITKKEAAVAALYDACRAAMHTAALMQTSATNERDKVNLKWLTNQCDIALKMSREANLY